MRVVDLPEALPDGSRLLHIGMPKTGTTALQGALHAARAELEARGVHNVGRGRHEMDTALAAAGRLPDFHPDPAAAQARWAELAEEFRTSTARITLWSSESLSQAPPERIRHLAEQLGADTHIVITLRPLAPLLVSQWQEVLRRRGTRSLDEWLGKHFEAVAPDGEVRLPGRRGLPQLHRFSLRRIVEQWGEVFGEERLLFLVPDADRQRGLRVFEALAGVPELLRPPPVDNASLPYPEAEMLRQFNRAYTEHGGDHGTWMLAFAQHARPGLRRLTGSIPPSPIRAPRWVAERCNDYTADWIEALRDSDATVVGDVEGLLSDPLDFAEEVDVPTAVSTETAGRLMDIGFTAALAYGAQQRSSRPAADLTSYTARQLADELLRRARRRIGGRS